MRGILEKLRRLLNLPQQVETEGSEFRSKLADLSEQFEGELAAVKAKLTAVEAELSELGNDLDAQLAAKLGIKVRQRLIEQEHAGVAHQRAADRDALPLTA
jgi:hypothetical protein